MCKWSHLLIRETFTDTEMEQKEIMDACFYEIYNKVSNIMTVGYFYCRDSLHVFAPYPPFPMYVKSTFNECAYMFVEERHQWPAPYGDSTCPIKI